LTFSPVCDILKSEEVKPMLESEKQLPELMTVTEVAQVLRMSSQAIRDMIKRGEINAVRVGRQYRIPRSEVERITAIETEGKP
jgi:excisionase family DNA binding protein